MKASFVGMKLNELMDIANGTIGASAPIQFSGEPDAPLFIMEMKKSPGQSVSFDLFQDRDGKYTSIAPTQRLECWFPK